MLASQAMTANRDASMPQPTLGSELMKYRYRYILVRPFITHSKRLNITTFDRLKQTMKVLAHLSLLFLVGITTYKTPVFAQDSIQETCSKTKVSLPIFIPLKELKNELERVVPKRIQGGSDPKYSFSRSGITLAKVGDKLQARVALNGDAKAKPFLFWISVNIKGEVRLSTNPKFKENWGIEPNFERDVSVSKAKAFGGFVSVKELVKQAIRKAVDSKISGLSSYLKGEGGLKKSLRESWSALNAVVKLSRNPPIWLVMTPQAFAATQPRITTTGIYLNFVAEAETDLKLGTMPKRSASITQLPPTLRIMKTSENRLSEVMVPISINYGIFNTLIEDYLKSKPAERKEAFGTIKLNKITLVPAKHGSFTLKTVISLEPIGWLERFWYWIAGKERGAQDIELASNPALSSNGKQIVFKNVSLSGKSSQLILKLAKIYEGLTGKLVEDLIQDNVSINLNSFIASSERDLQVAINRYTKKLQEEKNIKITAKILPETHLASIRADEHGFLIKACAAATLAINNISFDL